MKNASTFTPPDGIEQPYTEEMRKEEITAIENIIEKTLTPMDINFTRTYPI